MTIATTQRVRKSLLSMLIARPLSAIGGLLVLVLLSRSLSPEEYALYFSIWAATEIALLVSNFGLMQAVYRYISASELINGKIIVHGPVVMFLLLRILTLFAVASIITFTPSIFNYVFTNANLAKNLAICVAIIIIGEGVARYIESIFDSMMCQSRSQFTMIFRTMAKFLAIAFFVFYGALDIQTVIYIEIGVALLGALFAMLMITSIIVFSPKNNNEENTSYKRMLHFAIPGFIAQIIAVTYSADALKIVLSNLVGVNSLAVFGFAYSLAAVVQRYMPANILAGVFRPVFVAASKKDNSEKILPELLGFLIKLNWLYIAPIFCSLFFFGDYILSKISSGNYPAAGMVLSLIVFGLFAIAVQVILSMYCLAKETSVVPLIATAVAALGLPIAIYLGKEFGVIGVAIAFGLGDLIWSISCVFFLFKAKYSINVIDYKGMLKIVFAVAFSIAAGLCIRSFITSADLLIGIVVGALFFVVIYFSNPFTVQEKVWLYSIIPTRLAIKLGLKNY